MSQALAELLHVLRNPHGFTEDQVRQARLAAADRLESNLEARRWRWCRKHAPDVLATIAYRYKAACAFSDPDDAVDAAMVEEGMNPIVHAQHGETGRMWSGQRSRIPEGYAECAPPPAADGPAALLQPKP